jgi:hypothetical protein
MAPLKRWFLKQKNKLFPIKKYLPGVHYVLNMEHPEPILTIDILKGPYQESTVGFETTESGLMGSGGNPRLILKTVLLAGDYDFTFEPGWCKIAGEIFSYEWDKSLENYKTLREEVLNDENEGIEIVFEEDVPRTGRIRTTNIGTKKKKTIKKKSII